MADTEHSKCFARKGVRVQVPPSALGHASAPTTSDLYAHLLPEVDVALVGLLGDAGLWAPLLLDCAVEWYCQVVAISPVAAFLDRFHLHTQSRRDAGGRAAAGEQGLDVLQELHRRESGFVLDGSQCGDGHDLTSAMFAPHLHVIHGQRCSSE